jgi:hypothetical protein
MRIGGHRSIIVCCGQSNDRCGGLRDDLREFVVERLAHRDAVAMLALAILTAITAPMPAQHNDDLIALTVPEIRRLINTLILARPPDILLTLQASNRAAAHAAPHPSACATGRSAPLSRPMNCWALVTA